MLELFGWLHLDLDVQWQPQLCIRSKWWVSTLICRGDWTWSVLCERELIFVVLWLISKYNESTSNRSKETLDARRASFHVVEPICWSIKTPAQNVHMHRCRESQIYSIFCDCGASILGGSTDFIFTHCQELMKSKSSHGSLLSLWFVKKVWSDTYEPTKLTTNYYQVW
jgi:hypothetical protein